MPRIPRVLSLVFVCLVAFWSAAQDAPPPPTPYPSPITGFVGRYVDSSQVPSIQCPPRTFRADLVKAAPEFDRLYMIVGSTFVGQTLSTFPERVASGPLQLAPAICRTDFGFPRERYLPFEQWMDPERTPGWSAPAVDSQQRLYDFDWDDRGYIYLAYSVFGLGIIDQDFQKVAQLFPNSPRQVVSFTHGASYYILYSDGFATANILDVTDPASPVFVRALAGGYRADAKTEDGHIAIITSTGALHIHTGQTLVTGAPPIQTFPASFADVTTDGTNFYALNTNADDTIHILSPNGVTFSDTIVPAPVGGSHNELEYGAGYLTLSRIDGQVRIYRVEGPALTLLHDGSYFANYLDMPFPHVYTEARMYLPIQISGQTFLVAASTGLGDLFTMSDAHPPLTITKSFGPATIQPYGTSTLTVTINNPTPVPVTFSLTDDYPANVVNSGGTASTTCGAGVVTAAAAGTSFDLNNAMLAANASCTVTVPVTSNVSGTWTNTIPASAIVSIDNTNDTAASADLVVERMAAPLVQKAFSRTETETGIPFRLTITITNPNSAGPISGLAFTDTYPSGLVNATPANAANTCGGTVLAGNGGTSLGLTNGALAASQTCTVSVDVVATLPGPITNTLPAGAVTSANADAAGAAAPATVTAAFAIEAIPTTSEWGLILLASALALLALGRVRF